MPDVVVIGAGITGLTLGWQLAGAGIDVLVLEGSDRAGGAIETVERDGVRIERGPQSLRGASVPLLSLLDAVGLREAIVSASPAAKQRFLWWGGKLVALPSGPAGLIGNPILPLGALLRAATEPLRPRGAVDGETVHAFVARRFGPLLADRLADPVIAGIFGGDARRIEVAAAFPAWVEAEREHGSLVLGMMRRARPDKPDWAPGSMFALQGGMQRLPDALQATLGAHLKLGVRVTEMARDGAGWRLQTTDGPIEAGEVVVCVPPSAAGFVPEVGDELAAIEAAPVAAVHLCWPRDAVKGPEGFGWLAPSSERTDVLGAIWVSSVFPDAAPDHVVVRVMMGGARAPERALVSPSERIDAAIRVVREVERIDAQPSMTDAPEQVASIPQYTPGHAARMKRLQGALRGVHFVGWGYTGVGVAHCVEAALSVDAGALG